MAAYYGWSLYTHALFDAQFQKLINAAETAQLKRLSTSVESGSEKLLKTLRYLVVEVIPQDPTRAEYRQGNALGSNRRHWFRAKFGNGRYRLFFRYNATTKVIIYAWVNDDATLRTYGSKTDAYAVFGKMLNSDNPPDDWAELLAASQPAQQKGR